MSDMIALIGKPEKLKSRNAIRLFTEHVDDIIDDINNSSPAAIITDYSRNMFHAVKEWIENHGIQDDIALGFCTYIKSESFTTAIVWYISFDRDEYRTMFMLCKDDIMQEI